jgi:hypothetical protein
MKELTLILAALAFIGLAAPASAHDNSWGNNYRRPPAWKQAPRYYHPASCYHVYRNFWGHWERMLRPACYQPRHYHHDRRYWRG